MQRPHLLPVGDDQIWPGMCRNYRSFDAMSTGERSDFIDSEKRQSQIAVSKSKSREVMKMGRE
jgi:hypothetical protein